MTRLKTAPLITHISSKIVVQIASNNKTKPQHEKNKHTILSMLIPSQRSIIYCLQWCLPPTSAASSACVALLSYSGARRDAAAFNSGLAASAAMNARALAWLSKLPAPWLARTRDIKLKVSSDLALAAPIRWQILHCRHSRSHCSARVHVPPLPCRPTVPWRTLAPSFLPC